MKNWQKNLLKYLLIFTLIFILAKASLPGGITPFSIAFALSLLSINEKGYLIALIFLPANTLSNLTVDNLIISCAIAFLLLIFSFIKIKNKKAIYLVMSFHLLLCYAPKLYFAFTYSNTELYLTIISFIISEIFLICNLHLLKAIKLKGTLYRFSIDEIICLCFLVTSLYCGISCIDLVYVNFYHIISIFSLIISVYLLKEKSLVFACLMGLGYTLSNLDISYLALFSLCALTCLAFKNNKRIFSALCILVIDVIFSLYLSSNIEYTLISIIETLIPLIIFMLIKPTLLDNLMPFITDSKKNILTKNIVNRNRDTLYKKLCELSEVFSEMDNVFKKTVRGVLPIEKAKEMLAEEACQKTCDGCLEKSKCLRAKNGDTNKVFCEILDAGFSRGKATLLDIPPYLTNRCTKVNSLLQCINNLILQYKQYANTISNLDSSKILVAEQLNGVSRIMKSLGSDLKRNVSFDETKENELINELTYNNITCSEAAIYEENTSSTIVNLVIKNEQVENVNIPKIASKVCGHKLTVSQITPSKYTGWSIINLSSATKYDVIFGYANKTKSTEEISGDTYSLLRLNDNRFMLALCDGMGSGENANKSSELAISLVENFYKAGFDNDIILNSVNKLLSINNEESYTALDIGVIDLTNNFADFIKVGAPVGFIKHKTTTDIIQAGALPMGILSEMQPNITKTVLQDGDIIVLVTDGITDAFDSGEKLCNYINNISSLNPQEIADNILDKAVSLNGGVALDDMTVLTCRVYSKK